MLSDIRKMIPSLLCYPEYDNHGLQEEAARVFSVPVGNVLFTNGSMEAIQIVVRTGDDWAIPSPSFWGYSAAARLSGRGYTEYSVGQGVWKNKLRNICAKHHGLFLCYPNNPAPQNLEKVDLLKLITDYPNCHFVIDETMLPFRKNYRNQSLIPYVCSFDNLTVILSLSKISGICGMRGGLLFAGQKNIDAISNRVRKYATNTISQHFFTKYLEKILDCDMIRWEIRESFNLLIRELENCPGIQEIIDAEVSFILVKFNSNVSMIGLRNHLFDEQIDVMYPHDSYPEVSETVIRISACTKPDARRIADSIRRFCSKEITN